VCGGLVKAARCAGGGTCPVCGSGSLTSGDRLPMPWAELVRMGQRLLRVYRIDTAVLTLGVASELAEETVIDENGSAVLRSVQCGAS